MNKYYSIVKDRLDEKFFKDRVDIDSQSNCWNWNKTLRTSGYANLQFRYKGSKYSMIGSRASYMFFKSDIKEGMFICHACDNPKCINPDHLWQGTHQENMDDMRDKGRYKLSGAHAQYGNTNSAKDIIVIGDKYYIGYCQASKSIGISDNGIRKRIKSGKYDYKVFNRESFVPGELIMGNT